MKAQVLIARMALAAYLRQTGGDNSMWEGIAVKSAILKIPGFEFLSILGVGTDRNEKEEYVYELVHGSNVWVDKYIFDQNNIMRF